MINIRAATKDDIDTLYDLILDIAQFHDQERYVVTDKQELSGSGFGKPPKFGALLAEFNGKAVGYLSYTWNYSIWKGCTYMNLDDLFVQREFRGRQIGLHLMQRAKDICREKDISLMRWEVESDNAKAIEFYKKLGARITEKGIFRWHLDAEK